MESEREEKRKAEDQSRQEAEEVFVKQWNASGLPPLPRLTDQVARMWLHVRLLDPWWAENYPAALKVAGGIAELANGAGGDGKIAKPMSVLEFVEGDGVVRKLLQLKPPRTRPPVETVQLHATGAA